VIIRKFQILKRIAEVFLLSRYEVQQKQGKPCEKTAEEIFNTGIELAK